MNNARKISLDKKDYMRAVLTDTLPSDVPIIFSNDGCYLNYHRVVGKHYNKFNIVKSLYVKLIAPSEDATKNKADAMRDQNKQSYPMKYKIIKNENSLRTLSLIHPRSQKNYCHIYGEYSDAITYLCDKSVFSIRRPSKVGSSFYANDEMPIKKYKEINIDTLEDDLKRKHASSFFSYSGFDRFYKFFNSARYFDLEKRFPQMWFFDVANCFDSIYTHTISWAVKNKEYVKKFVGNSNQFCQKLDTVMQRSNNNETNGIPVGSEFSRIFAEIIFQEIDRKVEISLKNKHGLYFGKNYEVVRYVDDYVVFSKDASIAKIVCDEMEDSLSFYNMHFNEMKISRCERPFFTLKSRVVVGVNNVVYDLHESLFEQGSRLNGKVIYPKLINRMDKLEQSFINNVKLLMGGVEIKYSDVSPYVVGVLYNRVLRLVESYKVYSQEEKEDWGLAIRVRDAFFVLLRLIFFFYSVSPSVSSSEKVARIILVVDDFIKNNLAGYLAAYRSLVVLNVENLEFKRDKNDDRNGYISLERLNIIIATSGFGENYAISKSKFAFSKADPEDVTYFDIVCLLYYFRDRKDYKDERDQLIDFALERIYKKKFDLMQDAESVYLFLDLLCCPFVDSSTKEKMLGEYLSIFEPGQSFDAAGVQDMLNQISQIYWFVKWEDLDLIKALERKALKRAY
ncbi:MAG: RNA-directed DNA polymerase [Marinospirillum sp.]|uniref:antiviral reverse transcriptase Drt3b n=1 Tax=Marinospirillum sp. TaxID=2183934 RepID=UPI0019E6B35A|nr:antiviral reverse transcriptase Drt3b [Marinospirillum sp.]MBE0507243.1 RNA-directed DNA polymerase [Marinospirillum sp.]